MVLPRKYRDRIYIIKDVILTLSEYGELNQTTMISFCGLNLKKHRVIIDELEEKGMISKEERKEGKRTVTYYKSTNRGLDFCKRIIEPYEELFPRENKEDGNGSNKLSLFIMA